MDKDMKKDVERLGQASRLIEEEQMHGDNVAGIIEINERTEDTNEFITKLTKKLKVWKGVLISGIVVFILILLYMLFTGVVYKKTTSITPDYKEIDPNIPTEVTETVEPNEEIIYWYYTNEIPDIDVSKIETSSVHEVFNQGYDIQYLDFLTHRANNEMQQTGVEGYLPLNLSAIPNDKVYMLDSLRQQYESTQRVYKKIDDALTYTPVTGTGDTFFNGAMNAYSDTYGVENIQFEFYNEATLQEYVSAVTSYFESGLNIIVYDDIDASEIQSGVEAVLNSYNNKEVFYLGDTDIFDKAVEQFSYLGDKVNISYISRDIKSTNNEVPADTKVKKIYAVKIQDSVWGLRVLAKANHWY